MICNHGLHSLRCKGSRQEHIVTHFLNHQYVNFYDLTCSETYFCLCVGSNSYCLTSLTYLIHLFYSMFELKLTSFFIFLFYWCNSQYLYFHFLFLLYFCQSLWIILQFIGFSKYSRIGCVCLLHNTSIHTCLVFILTSSACSWPAEGVPTSTSGILSLINKAHEAAKGPGPIVIHDDLGIGPSGVFIVGAHLIRQVCACVLFVFTPPFYSHVFYGLFFGGGVIFC